MVRRQYVALGLPLPQFKPKLRGASVPLKQPTGAATLAALRRTLVSESLTRWTLGPILVTDGTLIRSFASLPVHHASALPVG